MVKCNVTSRIPRVREYEKSLKTDFKTEFK